MEEIESLIQTHCFIVSDAILYGIEEAILLHNIKFWVRDNKANSKNFYDGRTWTYNSAKAFSKIFPYWTTRKISRLLDSLEKKGAIVSGNYNKAKYDRTKWYALSQEPSDLSKMTNGFVKSVQPIPDINTDINNSLDISYSRKPKKFVPPTVEEVQKYVEEINSKIDAQFFVDYYAKNNWKDKNDNPVKNWKLKLVTWDMRERKKESSSGSSSCQVTYNLSNNWETEPFEGVFKNYD